MGLPHDHPALPIPLTLRYADDRREQRRLYVIANKHQQRRALREWRAWLEVRRRLRRAASYLMHRSLSKTWQAWLDYLDYLAHERQRLQEGRDWHATWWVRTTFRLWRANADAQREHKHKLDEAVQHWGRTSKAMVWRQWQR